MAAAKIKMKYNKLSSARADRINLCLIGDVMNSAGTRNARAETKAETLAIV